MIFISPLARSLNSSLKVSIFLSPTTPYSKILVIVFLIFIHFLFHFSVPKGHFLSPRLRYGKECRFVKVKAHQSFSTKLQKRNPNLLFCTILKQFFQSIHLVSLAGSSQPKFGWDDDYLALKLWDLNKRKKVHKEGPLLDVEEVFLLRSVMTFLLLRDSLFWHSIHLQISRQSSPAW